jgi:hypothetical protein
MYSLLEHSVLIFLGLGAWGGPVIKETLAVVMCGGLISGAVMINMTFFTVWSVAMDYDDRVP